MGNMSDKDMKWGQNGDETGTKRGRNGYGTFLKTGTGTGMKQRNGDGDGSGKLFENQTGTGTGRVDVNGDGDG